METNFLEFKEEILKRTKEAHSCVSEYKRAYASESFSELMQVIKYNFNFACINKIIDSELIKTYESQFNRNEIFCNISIEKGYLLCDADIDYIKGTAKANISGNATIQNVWDNATIQNVRGNATIQNVWDNATIQNVRGNATIQNVRGNDTIQNVWDNAYISSYSIIECKLNENAIHRIRESNTIRYASDKMKFEKV